MANNRLLWTLICCSVATIVLANEQPPESKYQEIIQLFNTNNNRNANDHTLKAEAQTYSATVADPNGGHHGFTSSGYSRTTDPRSRYSPSSSSSSASNAEEEEAKKLAEEEEERKPDRLALLLAESKFSCDGVKNGYYADETVGCQVFHYCVEGVKHSWQCPENTVFHQIHLNCVPNTQDICQQSSKYHIVNEYLHKELDERGPNNTVLYHQRFYPDGFDYSGGDPVAQIFQAQAQAALQKAHQARRQPPSHPNLDEEDDDDEPSAAPVRSRTRSRTQSYLNQATNRAPANKPQSLYRQPPPLKPTLRPSLSGYTSSPDTSFSPPTYTEQPQDDFGNTDFSDHHSSSGFDGSSSLSASPNAFSSSTFQSPSSSQSFQPSGSPSAGYTSTGSASSYQSTGSSSNSFLPSNTNQGTFRSSPSRGSSSSGYPTRSLGIPIASFRVAPASNFAGSEVPNAQASTIQQVKVSPMMSFTSLNNNGADLMDENRAILYY
ncbi:uncharacterized protein LOC124497563 [Dermatophagoides farinae]|uniref:uncharacterized protein LOC124497563 n=1 Tax=Dermatophagoides farinae TaxID=6954 RepID=UPI003F60037B